MSSPIAPPNDLAFTQLIDHHLAHNPNEDYALLAPSAPSDSPEHIHITWQEFGRAVHRTAYVVREALPVTDAATIGNVVGIIALVDPFLYHATVMGVVQSGNIVSVISPTID